MKNKSLTTHIIISFVCFIFLSQNIFPIAAKAASNYEGTLIISVWGGATEEWFRKSPATKFKKMYPNVKVIYDLGGMSARYNKLLAQKNNPEIDLFISTGEVVFAASSKGLLKKINKQNIPNMNDLYKWALPAPEYGAAYGAIAEGLCYNPKYFGGNPPICQTGLSRRKRFYIVKSSYSRSDWPILGSDIHDNGRTRTY